jgi:chemosensory pili system protein ChpA (sensor histidine kinase/response regulator)
MLAESVEDVAMVQSNMLKGLQSADADLTSQSRLTRDLQQQLMRVRLVPFSNISERLYRVARQAAKELDKRVNLDLRGASTELDRGVLEKMTAPFEHLIRNAIVHGLESPAERRAAGKLDTGELVVDVRQEGNEIIVVINDDGAGLNLEKIAARAVERQLASPGQELSDRELMEMIFQPGFTTASEVTELAGRGVGMEWCAPSSPRSAAAFQYRAIRSRNAPPADDIAIAQACWSRSDRAAMRCRRAWSNRSGATARRRCCRRWPRE